MQENYTDHDRERIVLEENKNPRRTEFERDRDRVLHSAALRRLGTKTQVLGPESDDFIRTRLTHSLEVAQVGRALAKNLGCDLDIVETACLAHDIGHPPFGHNGEKALDELAQDFGGFEGNAQTLRVLTRLEPKCFDKSGKTVGLNLTRATLDATVKYPWTRFAGPNGKDSPKFGAYEDDLSVFTWVRFPDGDVTSAQTKRSLEAQVMDLSDDIAYSVHDVEDSIVRSFSVEQSRWSSMQTVTEKALADLAGNLTQVIDQTQQWYGTSVSVSELEAAYSRLRAMETWPAQYVGTIQDLARLKNFTSDLIGRFIQSVTEATWDSYGTGAHSRYSATVIIPSATLAEIMLLKGIAVYYMMAPRENEPMYFEQRTVLFDLYDAILEAPLENLDPFFKDFWLQAATPAQRSRVVIDQLASLTDQSARQWHARLCGMLRR